MGTEAVKPEEGQQQESSTGEESGQEQQGQQQGHTGEEPGNVGQQQGKREDDGKLPDDHPVVKALAKANAKSAQQATELTEARAQAAKVTKLEEDLAKRPTTEAMTTLQTRYDRLEGFLQAAGGPLGKALDSRSFTRDLFETDKDIADIVKDWHKANPSATTTALSSAAAEPGKGKVDPNVLLRIAAGK